MVMVIMQRTRWMVDWMRVKILVIALLMVTRWYELGRARPIRLLQKRTYMNVLGTLSFALGARAACADEVVPHHIEPTLTKARQCRSFPGITDSWGPNSTEATRIARLLQQDKARSYV